MRRHNSNNGTMWLSCDEPHSVVELPLKVKEEDLPEAFKFILRSRVLRCTTDANEAENAGRNFERQLELAQRGVPPEKGGQGPSITLVHCPADSEDTTVADGRPVTCEGAINKE